MWVHHNPLSSIPSTKNKPGVTRVPASAAHSSAVQGPSFSTLLLCKARWIKSLRAFLRCLCCNRMTWSPYKQSSFQRSSKTIQKCLSLGILKTSRVLQKRVGSVSLIPGPPDLTAKKKAGSSPFLTAMTPGRRHQVWPPPESPQAPSQH